MSEITNRLDNAKEIIRAAIQNCSEYKNNTGSRGVVGNQYWGIPNDDNTYPGNQYWGIPNDDNTRKITKPGVYPVRSFGISIEGGTGIYKFIDGNLGSSAEVFLFSDGSYQLAFEGNGGASIGVPGLNIGIGGDSITGVTFDISNEQAQLLREDPKNLMHLPANLVNNINSISFKQELSIGLDTLGIEIPEGIKNQLENANFEIPDEIDGSGSHEYKLSKDGNGNWNIASTFEADIHTTEVTEKPNGFWGNVQDRLPGAHPEDVIIAGTSNGYAVELNYNTGTGELSRTETITNANLEGEGRKVEYNTFPGFESGDLTIAEGTNVDIQTETVQTTYDANGNVISTETTTSSGNSREVSVEAIVANGGGGISDTDYDPPVREGDS